MENDNQPEKLDDEIVEHISNLDYLYLKDIKLLSNEKKKCHKTPYILHIMSLIKKQPEQHAYHMLFMYYPFGDEKTTLSRNPPIYASKLSEPDVINFVNQKYSLVEPFATSLNNTFKF